MSIEQEQQQVEVVNHMLEQIAMPVAYACHCEICKAEIASEEYDKNLGVCDDCNRRLE